MPFYRIVSLLIASLPILCAQEYKLEPIPVPGWPVTLASSINNRGAIVGGFHKRGLGPLFGFKRDANGVFEFPIDNPDSAGYTYPLDINDYGVIVGYYYDSQAVPHGFVLRGGPHGRFTTVGRIVGGINDRGDYAGSTEQGGFVSIGGNIAPFNFPGGSTEVWGIGWDRTIIGSSFQGNLTVGFLRGPAGRFLGFRVPNAVTTVPLGINTGAGKIVGYYDDQSGQHGFVYDYVADLASDSTAATRIRTIPVQTIDYPGSVGQTQVTDINEQGVIVGHTSSGISFTGTPIRGK